MSRPDRLPRDHGGALLADTADLRGALGQVDDVGHGLEEDGHCRRRWPTIISGMTSFTEAWPTSTERKQDVDLTVGLGEAGGHLALDLVANGLDATVATSRSEPDQLIAVEA